MFGKKFCAALCGFSMFWATPKCEAGWASYVLGLVGVLNIADGCLDLIDGISRANSGGGVQICHGLVKNVFGGVCWVLGGTVNDSFENKKRIKELENENDKNKEKIKELENKVGMISKKQFF